MHISSLPYFTGLYKDYVLNFEHSSLRTFFTQPPSIESAASIASDRLDGERRFAIADIIRRQHDALGLRQGDAVSQSLSTLEQAGSVAVVTGQQVSIFGGPLYTFYKAATAIFAARTLTDLGRPAVPVFWLETEDHDAHEAFTMHVIDRDNESRTLHYRPSGHNENAEKWRRQIGPLTAEWASVDALIAELRGALPTTDFTEKLLSELGDYYSDGATFAEAFAKLLHAHFAASGLLILDANRPEAKALAAELFRREIEESPALSEAVIRASTKLEEEYFAQVKPKAINLFYIEDGERLAIEERDRAADEPRSFFLRGSRKKFTLDELLAELEASPGKFSPNVLMRPLYQDTLLPTAIYIGGPGEIAYFAQFKPAYEWAGIPMPVILPRVSLTIVEARFERTFKKFGFRPESLLSGGTEKVESILQSLIDPELPRTFDSAAESVEAAIEKLRGKINAIDPSLNDALTTIKGKAALIVRGFGSKALSAEKKKNSEAQIQLYKLLMNLLPEDGLQERALNLISFTNKYGPQLWQGLREILTREPLSPTEHHIFYTDGLLSKATASASVEPDA